MPLWKVYHSEDALTDKADKAAIAKGAVEIYRHFGLPDFYVHVIFETVSQEDNYTSGGRHSTFVIMELVHIARNYKGDTARAKLFKDKVDQLMMPFTTDKGIHLEYAVVEGPAAMWRIDGVDPPEAFGPEEQEQAEINRKILADKYQTTE
ncbi:hypothetical protein NQ176_g2860 [Zarea fungicola]|uniref:Uncharacterized protein n=1 Tax=Zarea fungicola TaxID=93591 RepID=A0ACC1NMA8_9HYPO|nr:hypothetical protein NQ176_g2860 [Lecanicillium fungicola]